MLEITGTLHPLCKTAAVQPVRGPGREGGGGTPKLLGPAARADHVIGVEVGNSEGSDRQGCSVGGAGLGFPRKVAVKTDRIIVPRSFVVESLKMRVKLLQRVLSKSPLSFL